MKASEIRELTNEELADKIDELSLQYTKMRLGHVITPLESPASLKQSRRVIAKLKTELRARELAQ